MKFLNWIKSRNKEADGEGLRPSHANDDRGAITQIWNGPWESDGRGKYEFSHRVGRSRQGFRGGILVFAGGEQSLVYWGSPRKTEYDARTASYGMRDGWDFADRLWTEMEDKQNEPASR
jgi:hypothetical protein